jgi:lysyl-tRNA synthetase class 2
MREYSELEKIRLAKLERLRAAGMEAYPPRVERTHTTTQAITHYQLLSVADEHAPHGA